MRRTLVLLALTTTAVTAGLAYDRLARERAYRRLIAVGDQALAADRTFDAIEAFSGAIALKADSVLAYLRRGEAYRRQGQLGAAERDIRQAWQLDRSSPRPLELLGDLQLEVGNYARAAERYADYLRLDDRAPRVHYKLALARYRGGDAAGAVASLRAALALDDRLLEAHYLLGLSLRRIDRREEALRAFAEAVRLAPALIAAREELADLLRELGRAEEEVRQLETLVKLDPRPARFVALGLACARAGRTARAVETLGTAADRYPEEPAVYVALARVWLEVAERRRDRIALGKAIEALEGVPADAAGRAEADLLLGRAFLLAGDAARAQRVLERAVARYPFPPEALLELANAAERAGDLAAARLALVKYDALRGPGQDRDTFLRRARRVAEWSMRLGEPGTAVAWLTRALEVSPADVGLLARLAEAELAAGDREAARETVRRGLDLDPRDRTLAALARRLRSGGG